MIRASGDGLLTIINDILDFSKIDAGKLELDLQPFDPQACIEDALELVAPQAFAKGLHLTYQIDSRAARRIVSDITRVRQILFNLLSNAIKFTEAGDVTVTAAATPLDAEPSRCASRSPTPASAFPRIASIGCSSRSARSTRRRRASTAAPASAWRSAGGSRRCSAAASGSKAKPGKGSRFSFTIRGEVRIAAAVPERPDPAVATGPPAASGERHPLRVLVAEDNVVNQKVALAMLRHLGYRADLAADGLEAVESVRPRPYDMVFMDLQMPELDGLDAMRQIISEHPSGGGRASSR